MKSLIAIGMIGLILVAPEFALRSIGKALAQNAPIDSTQSRKANTQAAAGHFKVHFKRWSFLSASAFHDVVLREQQVERIVAILNKTVSLPEDLHISVEPCGGEDAFYDEHDRAIVVCNELLDRLHRQLSVQMRGRARLRRMVLGTMTAIVLHEVAHALIDLWSLPVTGRQEDAADQFSAIMLLAQRSEGEQMLLDTANVWKVQAAWFRKEATRYWDQHSTDGQRFYDSICMLYGENPVKFGFLVRSRTLPFERAELCSKDYQRTRRAWAQLLAPYLKEGVTLLPASVDTAESGDSSLSRRD